MCQWLRVVSSRNRDKVGIVVKSGQGSLCVLDGVSHTSGDSDLRLNSEIILLLPHQELGLALQHKEKLQQKIAKNRENIQSGKLFYVPLRVF